MTVTTFYTVNQQPTIKYTENRSQTAIFLLSVGVAVLFAVMILENLFSALIRLIYGELVGLAAGIGDAVEIIGAIARAAFYAVPHLYKSAIVIIAWQVAVCCLESVEVVL